MNAVRRRQLAEKIAYDMLNCYLEQKLISPESMLDAIRLVELHIDNAEKAERLDYLERNGYARGCDEH